MKPSRVLLCGLLDVSVDCDPLELGDVVEGDWFPKESEYIAATRPAEGSILVVG